MAANRNNQNPRRARKRRQLSPGSPTVSAPPPESGPPPPLTIEQQLHELNFPPSQSTRSKLRHRQQLFQQLPFHNEPMDTSTNSPPLDLPPRSPSSSPFRR